jgi:hypothetical protein
MLRKEEWRMKCSDMKVGQIFYCADCGLELQVVKECTECDSDEGTCSEETCTFSCCNEPMKLKS